MSKNLFKKGLAFGAVLSLGVTGLTGIAASAATGDVTLAPKTGTGTTAFATDVFTLSNKVKTSVVSAATFAYRIDNPDQNTLVITLPYNAKLFGLNAAGAVVAIGTSTNAKVQIDFAAKDIVSVVAYDFATAPSASDLVIQLKEDVSTADSTAFTSAASDDRPEYGELTAATSVDVTGWVETTAGATEASYKTVEADFASTKQTITFVDPSSVNVTSKIERVAGASTNNKLTTATKAVRVATTANVTPATAFIAGETVDGVVLVAGDKVLAQAQTDETENGIYTVVAVGGTVGALVAIGSDKVLVLEGTSNRGVVFVDGTGDAIDVSAGSAAAGNSFNAGNDNVLGASIDFSNQTVNLAQVDLTKWEVAVVSSSDDDVAYGSAGILQVSTPAGYSAVDAYGRLLVQAPVADLNLNDAATYSLKFRHSGDTVAPIVDFVSPGYQVVESPTSTATQISAAPTTSTDAVVGTTYSSGYDVSIRNGVSAVTYKSQIKTGGVAVETANVPVLAVVTAGANLPTGATIQVSGATETIKAASAALIVTGLTDSKGNWSVTVTSSDTSSAGSAYTIQFYVLQAATPDAWVTADNANSAIYKADYAGAALATVGAFTADSTILSGATATVTFSVKDQYGQPLSATSTGKAYSVELKAPDKKKLEQFIAVVNGKATFTITNYLAAGESEILTAKLFTGTSTSPTYVASAVEYVTLYNANAVAGVNVVAEVTGVTVSYDDFITGASSATNVAPTDGSENGTGDDFVYTGTVVDANGAGVPGAPVTISGKGFQFVKTGTTTYYVDSITVAASDAGTFSVRAWTHVASATGNVITATSGAKSGTTKVKSARATTGLSSKDLSFSWSLPALPVSNTTYAVTATLADKWGNPVSGATVVFSGYAAAQFNGAATATKTTDKNGKATAYLRTLKDVSGLAAVAVQVTAVTGTYTGGQEITAIYTTDDVATKWNETLWSDTVESNLDFFAKKPTASIKKASTSSAVVKNASGATVKIVRGSKSVTKVATSNSYKVTLKGGTGSVKVYVNGVKVASK